MSGVSARYRRHPIHLPPSERLNRSNIIFVTACTDKRRKILASPIAYDAIVGSLEKWMRYWKSIVTRNLGEPPGSAGNVTTGIANCAGGESYDEKWDYVCRNPVRHALVSGAEEWPYQGTMNELRW